ncbi:MAG: hypothetical protein VX473_05870 [Candidatus Thermoplasmatota archaeon]|nr:hypothetical protein [Candidatus Thermoplasmatota archaeon]
MTQCHLSSIVPMLRDDARVNLPRPYGEGFASDDGLDELISNRLNRMEKSRRFWGRLANTWSWTLVRHIIPTLAIFTAVTVMAIPERFDPSIAALVSAMLVIIFISPSALTSNYSLWVGLDRLGARGRTRDEQDSSIERILNTLTESRLHEHMRFSNLLAFSFLLWLADIFPIGDETRGLLLVASILAASIAVAHTILVERRTPNHSDDLPFLVHHAPSQHKSTLENPLTEILLAHLDPESAGRFAQWREQIESSLEKNDDPHQSIEHILHLVNLRGQKMISHQQFIEECESLFGENQTKTSLLENTHLNLPTLSRLMGHTRGWQSDLFRQIDRLQFGLMDHNESIAGHSWRLDASLPIHCGESSGDLFVMVNNLGKDEAPIELEVHVPDGQPSRQRFRLTPTPLTPPDHPLPMWSNDEEDVVTWLSNLVGAAHVLWLGVAWSDEIEGRRPVRISIRHIDGQTISSHTLWTQVHPRSSGGESLRRRMGTARAAARRWQNQALTHTDRSKYIAP